MSRATFLRDWYLLQRQKARRLAGALPEEPPAMGGAPTITARGQTFKVFVRVSDYAGGTPDNVEVQLSANNSTWTYTFTATAPALDTPLEVTGSYYYSGGAWVRVRYQCGEAWSDWSNHDKVDAYSAPPAPDVSNWNTNIYEAEYRVISYGSPARDVWRIETGPTDGGPWTLWSEGAPPPEDETVAFLQPDFGGYAPTVYCRFRYHDNELDKTSPWVVLDPWSEP
jgi:hypothetical protein